MSFAAVVACCVFAFAGVAAADNYTVLWQFTRPNGLRLSGDALAHQLNEVRMTTGDAVVFNWDEGFVHGLFEVVDVNAWDSCDVTGGTSVGRFSTIGHVRLDQLSPGTHYYIDDNSNFCSLQLKIKVTVFLPENFVTDPPTPAPGARPSVPQPATGVDVNWRFLNSGSFAPIRVWQDDYIRFRWSNSDGSHTLRQVTKEAYDSCNANLGVVRTWQTISSTGDVNVTGLDIGTAYFLCYLVSHCSAGGMRLQVEVLPPMTRYFVTVWTLSGAAATPVNITFTGVDDHSRVWTAPPMQLNQHATDDLLGSITDPINNSTPGYFEVFAQNVGTPTAIRLRSPAAWRASNIRVQMPDDNTESKTFACTPVYTGRRGAYEGEQFCVEAVQPTPNATILARNDTPSAQECTCYREIIVKEERILICTSDGCFATDDTGLAGWSDMPEVTHLTGVGTDDILYGTNAQSEKMRSLDLGITWESAGDQIVAIATPVLDYTFNVTALTTVPLDRDVFRSGSLEWGVSSQGVHYNLHGEWILHGLWACRCEGACGLKCNQ